MQNSILIFDFDGTIADSFQFVLDICNKLASEFKYNKIEPHEVESLKNHSAWQTMKHLHVPVRKVPFILARAKREMNQDINRIEPIDGLKELLLNLKNLGYHMGILTTNSSRNVVKFLKNHEIEFFDFVTSSSKVWGKNHKLKTLMRKYKVDPSQILYIGDEVRDIEAAKKAGVTIAAVTWGFNSLKALKACNPNYLVNHPQELFELCRKRNS